MKVIRPRTLAELAAIAGASVEGDAGRTVTGVNPPQTAQEGDLTFLLEGEAAPSGTDMAVIGAKIDAGGYRHVIRCSEPRPAMARILAALFPERTPDPGIHPTAVVHARATIDPEAFVGAHAVVARGASIGRRTRIGAGCTIAEDCRVGADCVLHPRVVLYPRTVIGERVIVHAGAVIGSDGFGYAQTEQGHLKIPQVGRVVVHDDVEIGANTTIDRGTLGETVIGAGTKIDNLAQIAHNVTIGPMSILVSQVGIGGSTRIGAGCVLAGQVGVADHVVIEDRVTVGAKTGVPSRKVLKGPGAYFGTLTVRPARAGMREVASLRALPDLLEKVRDIDRRVARLETDDEK